MACLAKSKDFCVATISFLRQVGEDRAIGQAGNNARNLDLFVGNVLRA